MAHVLFTTGFSEDRERRSKISRGLSAAAGARVAIGPGVAASEMVQVLVCKPRPTFPRPWEYRGQDGAGFHAYEWACGSCDARDIVNRVLELLATP
jgi:hypothetical protein